MCNQILTAEWDETPWQISPYKKKWVWKQEGIAERQCVGKDD